MEKNKVVSRGRINVLDEMQVLRYEPRIGRITWAWRSRSVKETGFRL